MNTENTTGRRGVLAALATGGFAGAAALASADSAEAATIVRTDLANALGFWPVLSDTPPTMTTVSGRPVVWLQKAGNMGAIPALPVAPYFDDSGARFMVPNGVVGIQYRNATTNSIVPGGSMQSSSAGSSVTVKAEALPGYTIPNGTTTSWTHKFIDYSKTSILASDAYDGSSGTALNGRSFDNKLGGSVSLKWRQFWDGEGFRLNGQRAIANTGSRGWYRTTTGTNDHRVSFQYKWTNQSQANASATFSVGASTSGGGVSLTIGDGIWKLVYATESQQTVTLASAQNSGAAPSGGYILEIVANQVGLKTPTMSTMQYYDITHIDRDNGIAASNRGSDILIRTDHTNANVFTVSNYVVTKIGA